MSFKYTPEETFSLTGMTTSFKSQLGFRMVDRGPTKKSRNGISISPDESATIAVASIARSGGAESAEGEALHRLPPRVPMLRSCHEPTRPVAHANAGSRSRIT